MYCYKEVSSFASSVYNAEHTIEQGYYAVYFKLWFQFFIVYFYVLEEILAFHWCCGPVFILEMELVWM